MPAAVALQVAASGARPPVVAVRWMNVVSPSRSPDGPAVGEGVDSSSQGIAVGSTVTGRIRWPTTLLPSLACHVGPAKCLMISLPWSLYRLARGATNPQANPLAVGLHE